MSKTTKVFAGISLLLIVYAVLNLFGIGILNSPRTGQISVFQAIWLQSTILITPFILAICAFTISAILGVKRGGANSFYMGLLILISVLLFFGFIIYTNVSSIPSYETILEYKVNFENVTWALREAPFTAIGPTCTFLTLGFMILLPETALKNYFLIALKYISVVIFACFFFNVDLVTMCLGKITEANISQARLLGRIFELPYYVLLGTLCVAAFFRKEHIGNVDSVCAFSGRLRRGRFWPLYMLIMLTCISISIVWQLAFNNMTMQWTIYVFAILLTIPLRVRRLHDRNTSGWWIILFDNWLVISLAGVICYICGIGEDVMPGLIVIAWVLSPICKVVEFVLLCLKGTNGDNKYGADPLKISASDIAKLKLANTH